MNNILCRQSISGIKHIFRIMKITIIALFTCIFTLFATKTNSQNVKVSIHADNFSLREVIYEIEKQTDYLFVYDRNEVNINRPVSLKADNEPVSDVLNKIFAGTDVEYKLVGKNITLFKHGELSEKNRISQQSSKKVTGTVTDERGEPIIGANIMEKGTTNGVITDIDGNFSLSVSENAILQVSYIGYITQDVAVKNRATVAITLNENAQVLDEVIVVGFETQKKTNLTGAVSAIGAKELTKRPVSNIQNLLQGKLPGVQVIQGSGKPGLENSTIRIRGIGTFSSAGSSPLVLIDGVERDLSNINPDDVESISVLKDAASASIYGSRAANGVILVVTKKGKQKQTTVTYHGNFQLQQVTSIPDMLTNSADYMTYWNQARERRGQNKFFTDEEIAAYRNNVDNTVNYPNFDWVDYMFKTAPAHNHHISITGGNDKNTFKLSAGYLNQEGVTGIMGLDKYTISMNIDSEINKIIKVGGVIDLAKKDITQPSFDDIWEYGSEEYMIAIFGSAPLYTPRLSDGRYVAKYSSGVNEWTVRNPEVLNNNGSIKKKNHNINVLLYTDIRLQENLLWKTQGSFTYNTYFRKLHEFGVPCYTFKEQTYFNENSPANLGVTDTAEFGYLTTLSSTMHYNKTFREKHNLSVLGGFNQEYYYSNNLSGRRINFPTNTLSELNAGSTVNQSTGGSAYEWAIRSLFGRFNYNYADKYLLEVNARYDGTSRIESNTRWGIFPSVSVGWRISEEKFMQPIKWLDNLKLRGSYGKLGNQNIGTYPYQEILNINQYPFSSLQQGVYQSRMVDKNLKWESTNITDIGVDILLFGSKLSVTADWFNKVTSDILYQIPVPSSLGLSGPTINYGKMKNTGYELEVNYNNYIGKISYGISGNISSYKNKVLKVNSTIINGQTIIQEGLPWNSFYLVEKEGIFQTQEEIDNSPKHSYSPKPGDLKFKDQPTIDTNGDGIPDKGDGVIDANDRIVVKGAYPKFIYGGSINLGWNNFSITAFFQGVYGNKSYVYGYGIEPFLQGAPPLMSFVKEMWTPERPSNTTPAIYTSGYGPVTGTPSTYFLQDASYLRLKNLLISYDIPSKTLQKCFINNLQLYVSGDNLFTITKYKGMDPERASNIGNFAIFPQIRIFTLGAKINF